MFLSAPVDCELFEDRFCLTPFFTSRHPVAGTIPGMNLYWQRVFNLSPPM